MPATVEGSLGQATGRRKTAVARVRIVPGDGVIVVNNRPPSEYFGRRDLETVVTQPLRVTDTTGRFEVSVKVFGGGIAGQAGAVCHGIARALIAADPELRPVPAAAGLPYRDSARERAQENTVSSEPGRRRSTPSGRVESPPAATATVRARVLGCPVDIVDMATAVQTLVEIVERRRADPTAHPSVVVTLNPEMVMMARRSPAFSSVLESAALVVPDGIGLVRALRRRGHAEAERVGGADPDRRVPAAGRTPRSPHRAGRRSSPVSRRGA